MIRGGGRRAWRGAVAALALAAVVGGCASTGYTYVKNSEDNAYFKVPDDWTLFEYDEVLDKIAADLPEEQIDLLEETNWEVRFDASPAPSLGHFQKLNRPHPIGYAHVGELDFDTSDRISTAALRNSLFSIDALIEDGSATLLQYEPLELEGGFRGMHIVATVERANGSTLTYNQIAVLDQSTSRLFGLVVACNATCYDQNEDRIDEVVDSWTIEE